MSTNESYSPSAAFNALLVPDAEPVTAMTVERMKTVVRRLRLAISVHVTTPAFPSTDSDAYVSKLIDMGPATTEIYKGLWELTDLLNAYSPEHEVECINCHTDGDDCACTDGWLPAESLSCTLPEYRRRFYATHGDLPNERIS